MMRILLPSVSQCIGRHGRQHNHYLGSPKQEEDIATLASQQALYPVGETLVNLMC